MFGDDGSVLAQLAADALSVPDLEPHIGCVETVERDGADLVMVEVRKELLGDLTPRLIEALAGIPFRLRPVGIPDGKYYGGVPPVDDTLFPGVVVEPMAVNRPFIINKRQYLPDADLEPRIDANPVQLIAYQSFAVEGFVPIEDVMGEDFVAPLWPERHRRSIPNPARNSSYPDEDELRWYVRSPWPSITLTDYVHTMWRWVRPRLGDTTPRRGSGFGDRRRALVGQFLAQDEAWVLEQRDQLH